MHLVWIRTPHFREAVPINPKPNWLATDIIEKVKQQFELPLGTNEYCLKIENKVIPRTTEAIEIASKISENEPAVIDRTFGTPTPLTFRIQGPSSSHAGKDVYLGESFKIPLRFVIRDRT